MASAIQWWADNQLGMPKEAEAWARYEEFPCRNKYYLSCGPYFENNSNSDINQTENKSTNVDQRGLPANGLLIICLL